MAKIAIVYASGITHNTKHVAEYIASKTDSDLFDLKAVDPDIADYDEVVIGTGVHAGKTYKQVDSFIEKNRKILDEKKTTLFVMCIYSDKKGEEQLKKISERLSIHDAVFFNMKDAPKDGVPAAVDDLVRRLS